MSIGLWILIFICSLIGIIVCVMGMKSKNVLYKGVFYFLVLFIIERIYSLIIPTYILRLIDKGVDNPGLWIRISEIPPVALMAIALIILILYLFRGLRNNSDN